MQYQTIILELIQENKVLYQGLKDSNALHSKLTTLAAEFRESHLQTLRQLELSHPGSSSKVLIQQALELAAQEIEERIRTASQDI